jgi:tetratricopeptide (TPR) repeat protein
MAKDARLKVFWVPAISQRSFELAYREIGLRLRIPGTSDDNADVKKLVRDRLSQPSAGDWIIIVDNADDFNVLFGADNEQKSPNLLDWLPRSNRGSILFTTRNSKMAARLTPKSEHVCLERLGPAEAGQMLKRNILKKYLIGDDSTVNELLDILENLPLAIIQATAFINTNEITVVRYISLFRETRTSPVEIFSKNFHDESRYGSQTDEMYDGMDSTIAKTWHISFEQIRKQDPLAAEYLSFMACIDRINIPESVLPPEKPIVERLEAIGTLIGYAFIAKQQHAYGAGKEDFYDMHRLVHMSSILWLDRHGERATWARKALLRLLDMVPNGSHKDREVWTAYLPHAIYIVDHDLTMDDETKAAVLKRIGHCQVTLGQNATAEATYQRAFALRLKSSGEDDPRTLDTMNSIGLTLSNQGKYTAAEEMLRRTLKKQREVHGDDSRLTLTTSNNLASLLYDQGKYDDAEHMYRQNLELEKKTLEPGHPNILTSTGNLAFVLKGKQKNHEAEILYREVLKGQTRLHGREHPITMAVLGNLATALSSQGKKAEAISLTKEVLKYQEDTLGHDHPSTMVFLNNLACFLNEKDTYEQSEAMFTDLLARRKKVLGPEHPVTIATMSNLATCLDNQGKPEAEPSARESLRLSEKILTEHHPDTYLSVWGLAIVLGHQKQYEEAASLYAKAYDGLLACYGKEWNNTRQCRIDWDEMLAEQNDAQSVTSRLIYGLASFKVGRWKPFAKGDGRIISTH